MVNAKTILGFSWLTIIIFVLVGCSTGPQTVIIVTATPTSLPPPSPTPSDKPLIKDSLTAVEIRLAIQKPQNINPSWSSYEFDPIHWTRKATSREASLSRAGEWITDHFSVSDNGFSGFYARTETRLVGSPRHNEFVPLDEMLKNMEAITRSSILLGGFGIPPQQAIDLVNSAFGQVVPNDECVSNLPSCTSVTYRNRKVQVGGKAGLLYVLVEVEQ